MIKLIDTMALFIRNAMPILMNERGEVDGDGGSEGDEGQSGDTGDQGSSGQSGDDSQGQNADQGWLQSLPEETRSGIEENLAKDPNITKYKNLGEFLKGHTNLAKKIGEKGVIIPKEDASPEEIDNFYNALGRPKTPDEYKIDAVDGLHESISVTEESENKFKLAAHEMGLTNKQVNNLNQWYLKNVSDMVKAQEAEEKQAAEKVESELRSEWKDKYDSNVQKIVKMLGEETVQAIGGKDGLGNNPALLKSLGKIANMLSEDQVGNLRSPATTARGNESQQDARTKLNDMMSNPDSIWYKALFNEGHPKHTEAVQERIRLYEVAYPEES